MVVEESHDVVVVGGGLAGICAAVGAARLGAHVALVHERPLLGGNASGELRIHIAGADCSGRAVARYVRETGIIDEIRVDHLHRNPADSHNVLSLIMREIAEAEPTLELFLNTRVRNLEMGAPNTIDVLHADQLTTEKQFVFRAPYFVDCTGDGSIGDLAGAAFRMGREGQDEFGERLAPKQGDHKTLPSCVQFYIKDMGRPTPFTPPAWARHFESDADLPSRSVQRSSWEFGNLKGGFWWLSAGGDRSVIEDNEDIYRDLLAVLMGIWDLMKNRGDHGAEDFALDWISPLPGKRESRRLEGDRWLTEADVFGGQVFDDSVAYGGWPVDLHPPEGVYSKDPPNLALRLARPYTIPLRCLYSRSVSNLLMAGRDASVTHVAFGSARVMATCGVMGQAAGVAAALCAQRQLSPRQLTAVHVGEVRQALLAQGAYIPGCVNADPADLAPKATVRASSAAMLSGFQGDSDSRSFAEPLFQLLPVSAGRLDTVEILVECDEGQQFRAALRRAQDIWDFSSRVDLASCSVRARAGRQWLPLELDATNLEPGLYWLLVEASPDARWLGAAAGPLGVVRGVWEGAGAGVRAMAPPYRTLRGAYGMRLAPPSRPYEPGSVVNGVARPEAWPNAWISASCDGEDPWLELAWDEPVELNQVHLTFDGQLDSNIIWPNPLGVFGSETLPGVVRHYDLRVKTAGSWTSLATETDNYRPRRTHSFRPVKTAAMRLVIHGTNGAPTATVFEIRAY
jgi:hypothetical protein